MSKPQRYQQLQLEERTVIEEIAEIGAEIVQKLCGNWGQTPIEPLLCHFYDYFSL